MQACKIALQLLTLCCVCYSYSPAVAKEDKPRPRLLLLKTQLLDTPGGYPEFCTRHATKKRSVLRKEIVARLKAIAAVEQSAVLGLYCG